MKIRILKGIKDKILTEVIAIAVAVSAIGIPAEAVAEPQSKTQVSKKKSTGKSTGKSSGRSSKKSGRKSSGGNKSSGAKKQSGSSKSKTVSNKPETSAELKKRQESVRDELKKTEEEIRRNDASIKKGLSELSRLEEGITASKKETAALSAEVRKLNSRIATLDKSIAENTRELARLRDEYLKAVKKMRVSKKRNSSMAYIFGAKDLAQAERRMRYLKEFSEWKDSRTKDIEGKVALLKKENEQLAQAKSDKDVMLDREMKAQRKLTDQKQRQDALVAELRANGDALHQHLARKQAEANELRNRVAAVIAEEQRKAEEQRRAKEAEEQRLAKEREERRLAEEQQRKEQQVQEDLASNQTSAKESPGKETRQKETSKKQNKKQDKKQDKGKSGNNGDYASARKRKPRNNDSGANSGSTAKSSNKSSGSSGSSAKSAPAKTAAAGDFASMKGALPKPVAGSFRITSPFGRHSLPDLPDVTYDNPGIDAEVASGASAQAVYQGRVSGIYMVPGFSTVVIVNHGDYYTVYGNIASPAVKVGDNVKQGQSVGAVASDPDNPGHSTIHFEVWKGREKMNPSQWIK